MRGAGGIESGTTTFVTDGIEAAVEQARAAAATATSRSRQRHGDSTALAARLVEELQVHMAPIRSAAAPAYPAMARIRSGSRPRVSCLAEGDAARFAVGS